jgi:alpha-L-rhamnosidase
MYSIKCYIYLAALMILMVKSVPAQSPQFKVVRTEFVEPAPSVAEVHASNIIEAADGTLVCAWFGGTKEGNPDVTVWVSRYVGGQWTPGVSVADGVQAARLRYAAYNPVMHCTPEGRIWMFFKVGKDPESWWGESMYSDDNGISWTGRKKLPKGFLGPIKNKPVVLKDGTVICPSSIEYGSREWVAHMEITDEKFEHWKKSKPVPDPHTYGAIQPTIIRHEDGRLQALFRSNGRNLLYSWSKDSGRTWSPLEFSGYYMANSGIAAETLADNKGFLLVYNPHEKPDNPKSWGPRTPLVVSHSTDGLTWKPVALLEHKKTRWGYSYPSIIQAKDGRVHVTYTWNRGRICHVVLEQP